MSFFTSVSPGLDPPVSKQKDFFSRLEEDYSSRGCAGTCQQRPEHTNKMQDPKHKLRTGHRKSSKAIERPKHATETIMTPDTLGTQAPLYQNRLVIPSSVGPPPDLRLSKHDEKLFRYYCFGKPLIWITTSYFNRTVPCCMYGESFSSKALRQAILAKSALHISRMEGSSKVEVYVKMGRAISLIQEALSESIIDEALIGAVFYLMLTEMALGEFHKVHNHMKGLSIMIVQAIKAANGMPSMMLDYMAECVGYLQTIPAALGYPMVLSDEFLPSRKSWLSRLSVTPEAEKWIVLDFKHAEFKRQVIRLKLCAESVRRKDIRDERKEREITKEGLKLIKNIQDWQRDYLPKIYEEPPLPVCSDLETFYSRRFLSYPRYQFKSPLQVEVHLLFFTLTLITYLVIDPSPGSTSPGRVDAACRVCQCLAALGDNPGCRGSLAMTAGIFGARLTFDDLYPNERAWCEGRYREKFHFSVIELHESWYLFREAFERQWGVAWGGGRN